MTLVRTLRSGFTVSSACVDDVMVGHIVDGPQFRADQRSTPLPCTVIPLSVFGSERRAAGT
jgi:hypothetical protein